jgi:hypothetical protein
LRTFNTDLIAGWEEAAFLPAGWQLRKSEGSTNGVYDVDYWFLAPDGALFR